VTSKSASHGIGQLLRVLCAHGSEGRTDGQLLERFLFDQDEAAFAALVRRHGSMVLGVCRRILGNDADSEDAFQATFLVLVRKATSLASRSILGDWLHGVARHTALKTKAAATHRQAKEQAMARPDATAEEIRNDWLPLLDEELARLPEKYRLPIVLCDLEGKTRREAAEQLGWPEGTVAGRLARARTMLAKRLARHGLVLSGGALAVAISQNAASACVPSSLLVSTVKAAIFFAAGQAAATGLISANVAALTEGVLKAMLLTKIKAGALVLLMLGMVAFTCGMLAIGRTSANGDSVEQPAAKANEKPKGGVGDEENTLTVTIKPQKNRVRAKEPFKVDLRVVNSSTSTQSFRVMNCSWDEHWKSSNERVSWERWDCKENCDETVKLEPGEAYEKTLPMLLVARQPQGKVTFKMGFTPIGSKQTFWSNEITLTVEPDAKADEQPAAKIGYLKAEALGRLIHKGTDFRLIVQQSKPHPPIELLIRTNAAKSNLNKILLDLKDIPVIVTGNVVWLPKGPQVKSDDDYALGIVFREETQIQPIKTKDNTVDYLKVEAKGEVVWKDSYHLLVQLQEKPAKKLRFGFWVDEPNPLLKKLDALKDREAIISGEMRWQPKSTSDFGFLQFEVTPANDPEAPWGETVGGWRLRVTMPSGTEYRRNTPLPLLLELQNVSERPLPLGPLAWKVQPEVTEDGKRLVARPLIDVSPWEGRRDEVLAGASVKWTVDFDRIRFSKQPLKAGTALQVRFRALMQDEGPKEKPLAGQQRLLFSNEVSLKLRDDHPSIMAGKADLPPKWTDSMELVYREYVPLSVKSGYALRIDGAGRVWLVFGSGKGQAVRTEAVLNRDRLDRLAKFLRDQKVWELAELSPAEFAGVEQGEIRLSVGSGHGSLVRSFPDSMVRKHPALRVLKAEMEEVKAAALKEAAAKSAAIKEAAAKESAKEKPKVGDVQKPLDPKLLAKLAAQLRSKDWEERSAAVLALSKLLAATKDGETDFGPVIEPLFANAGWGGIARDNARMAEDSLVRLGGQATPLLRQRLTSADAHDRRVAAELLVRIGPPDAALVALLRPLLTDPDHYVRKAAIDGLGTLGPPAKAAVADLERVATNDPLLHRRVGARIALIRVAGASEERVRALAALIELKDELTGERKGELNPSGKEAGVYAASALHEMGPKAKAAEPQLLVALKNADAGVRANAAYALGGLGANSSPETITALIDLFKKDPQRSVAWSLGEIGPAAKAAIPALRAALKEDGKGGWYVAADALAKIGGAEVVPILMEALTNPDGDIRLTSMRGLGNLGAVARPALMALEKARQEDPRENNRAAAAEALRKIERAVPKMK
jgi:RNA polymerase sigma factor (sigma-70 family)